MHKDSDDTVGWQPEPAGNGEFSLQIERSLETTEQEIRDLAHRRASFESDASLVEARRIVAAFRPVPQIIWRLCNYSIGRPGHINKLSSGHAFGLKKLMTAIGHDAILGLGQPKMSSSEVVSAVASDIIAATSIMYAVSRRLQSMPFGRLWEPMLDEALLRANLGFCVGQMSANFGIGRAMLAGFAGRIGIVVLIASGSESQAEQAVAGLARRASLSQTAREVYGCDPAHVSAMLLSAAGCSRDAILGVGAFGLSKRAQPGLDPFSALWLATLTIIDHVLDSSAYLIDEPTWIDLGFEETGERDELIKIAQTLKRSGHTWQWLARPD
jgi:hypothetical protein